MIPGEYSRVFKLVPREKEEESLFSFLTTQSVRLAQIRRYATLPVQRPESVLEHSAAVGIISYLLAKDLGADANLAAAKALFHDFEEAITGDICRDFKYLDPVFRKSLEAVEPSVIERISLHLPASIQASFCSIWKWSKDSSPEGNIVEIADSISVLAYIYEEVIRGNMWLVNEPWDLAFPVAEEKLERMGFPENCLAARTLEEFQRWRQKLLVPPR